MKKLNQKGVIDHMMIAAIVIVLAVGGAVLWRITSSTDSDAKESSSSDALREDDTKSDSKDDDQSQGAGLGIGYSLPDGWVEDVSLEGTDTVILHSQEPAYSSSGSAPSSSNKYLGVFIERGESTYSESELNLVQYVKAGEQTFGVYKTTREGAKDVAVFVVLDSQKSTMKNVDGESISIRAEFNYKQSDYDYIKNNFPDFVPEDQEEFEQFVGLIESLTF